jgi:hypothetical protein
MTEAHHSLNRTDVVALHRPFEKATTYQMDQFTEVQHSSSWPFNAQSSSNRTMEERLSSYRTEVVVLHRPIEQSATYQMDQIAEARHSSSWPEDDQPVVLWTEVEALHRPFEQPAMHQMDQIAEARHSSSWPEEAQYSLLWPVDAQSLLNRTTEACHSLNRTDVVALHQPFEKATTSQMDQIAEARHLSSAIFAVMAV